MIKKDGIGKEIVSVAVEQRARQYPVLQMSPTEKQSCYL